MVFVVFFYAITLIVFFYLATGTCLPVWGKKLGEHCYNDQDCESGFLCMGAGAKRTCQTPTPGDKLLGKFKYKTEIHLNRNAQLNYPCL
jgi:hypothetical protein